jgi:DNA-binding winged helix-turn-helix (wHTH) protein
VERAGELVGKNELIGRPGRISSSMTAILGEGETGRRYIVTIPGPSYDFVAPISAAAEPAPVAFGAQTIPPRFPLQRTEPQREAQLPWPTNMFGEPATIAELQVEVVQLSESRENSGGNG